MIKNGVITKLLKLINNYLLRNRTTYYMDFYKKNKLMKF